MDRDDKKNSVILFGKNPAKVTVPSVTMDDVGIDVCSIEIGAPSHGTEDRAQRLWTSKIARVELEADDLELAFFKALVAKASHFHRHRFRQFAREITHMHACAAVDVRRILVSQKQDFHAPRVEQASALLSTEFASGALALLYRFTFNNSTGTSTSWRTLSAVAPYRMSLIRRWPCVVIAIRSTSFSRASLMIS